MDGNPLTSNLIEVHVTDISTTVSLSRLVPEFSNPYPEETYHQRIGNREHLLLAASISQQLVGFKAGYAREENGYFYSWMGGVLPDFRRLGVAKTLAEFQEKWAIDKGYSHIHMKTRNMHKNMLLFSISRGFKITRVEGSDTIRENRIYLEKKLRKLT
ncbi:MAG: GNAT family N-acetyltransferase [Bacteroidota bacterium]